MLIDRADVFELRLPLRDSYETSSARYEMRAKAVVRLWAADCVGHGENQANLLPNYSGETIGISLMQLRDFILPLIVGERIEDPTDYARLVAPIRGARMAKASVETAVFDLLAQREGVSLAKLLGGSRSRVPVGVAFGMEDSIDRLLEVIDAMQPARFQRIKLKVGPGWDVDVVRAVRETYPEIQVMVDANGAYTLSEIDTLRRLDRLSLMMIEQPLSGDDLMDHALVQRQLDTPICLDESVESLGDARSAIALGSCRILNLKPARVGGLDETRRIAAICADHGIGAWCGSLLEWGIGRAANLAIASLASFTYPADTEPSDRFYSDDPIAPPCVLSEGALAVPDGPGLGVTVDEAVVLRHAIRRYSLAAQNGRLVEEEETL